MEMTFSPENISDAARFVVGAAGQRPVIALYGVMGAGKTTLVREICRLLGVTDSVSSPTFSIINEYRDASGSALFHIDLYRLAGTDEALHAGVGDCLYSGNRCLVEWPEIAESLLPEDALKVHISVMSDGLRKLRINS